ncbi:MAG TPA: hypothetical protein VN445_07545 [Rectinemataceae bacterium]|nr:hypothetical protein [Rectinemataceae bacterium]
MSKPADAKKKDREELIAFKSNLAHSVRSMLDDFSRVRKNQVEKARNERRAVLLEIKNQVAGMHNGLSQEKGEEKAEKAENEIVPGIVATEAPAATAEQKQQEKEDWPSEAFVSMKPRKSPIKTKRMKKK